MHARRSEDQSLAPLLPPGMGAAYGTAKSGVGIASMGVMRPELVQKSIVPGVMAGVLGIYGLIIAVIISTNSEQPGVAWQIIAAFRASTAVPQPITLAQRDEALCVMSAPWRPRAQPGWLCATPF